MCVCVYGGRGGERGRREERERDREGGGERERDDHAGYMEMLTR